MIVLSDREIFVGAHVTRTVKHALRREAGRQRVSMSAFVADAILEKLRASGVTLPDDELTTDSPESTAA